MRAPTNGVRARRRADALARRPVGPVLSAFTALLVVTTVRVRAADA